jgi:hypothetical protein
VTAEDLAATRAARGIAAQEAAATFATVHGILPKAVQSSADGSWTLYDTTTGQEIGKAPDWKSAAALSTAHANYTEDRDADRIAAAFTAYQAAQVSGDWSRQVGRSTENQLDLGTTLTTHDIQQRSDESRARAEAQDRFDGGDGSIPRQILGESRTRQAEGQLRTINRILAGGSVLEVFHEEAHGFRRAARDAGTITREDDIAFVKAIGTILAGKTGREGQRLARLPQDFDTLSIADQDIAIDEAISKIYEAEIIRTRKGGGQRDLPAGLISNNLSALSRLLGDQRLGKFRSFLRSMREHFGLSIDLATQIQRGLNDGTLDRTQYEGYVGKLLGIGEAEARDGRAPVSISEQSDGPSFSLGAASSSGTPTSESSPSRQRSEKLRKPADDKGRFLGEVGNSDFELSALGAAKTGLPKGTRIPWRNGVPDFGQWAKSGPGKVSKEFSVLGMLGDDGDPTLIIQHIAIEAKMTTTEVRNWLRKRKLIMHHSGGDRVQLVPRKIHGLHHSGGALGLRLEFEGRKFAKIKPRSRPAP